MKHKVNKPKKGWSQEHIDNYMRDWGTTIPENVDSIIQLNFFLSQFYIPWLNTTFNINIISITIL